MTAKQPPENKIFFIAMLLCMIALAITGKCQAKEIAKLDTIPCKMECVSKILTQKHTSTKGNETVKYTIVYVDKTLGINEAIPTSKTVYEYIQQCSELGIPPSLGIKLKNREITSIVRIRKKLKL